MSFESPVPEAKYVGPKSAGDGKFEFGLSQPRSAVTRWSSTTVSQFRQEKVFEGAFGAIGPRSRTIETAFLHIADLFRVVLHDSWPRPPSVR